MGPGAHHLRLLAQRIQDQRDALDTSLAVPYPDDLAIAGTVVTVDQNGELRIERGLIRKEDMKKLPKGNGGNRGNGGNGKHGEQGRAGMNGAGDDMLEPVHSEKLTRMLTAHRTAAIQAELMNRPEVALAALVHRMALQVFSKGQVSNRIVQVSIERSYLKPDAENIEQSRAAEACSAGCSSKNRQTCTNCWPSARRFQSIPYRPGRMRLQGT